MYPSVFVLYACVSLAVPLHGGRSDCGVPCEELEGVLDCQDHDCLEVPRVKDGSKLKVVNMSRNHLYAFDGRNFSHLEILDLSDNNLMRDAAINLSGMLSLRHLNLTLNRLDERILYGKAFLGTSISVLSLSRNRIKSLNQSDLLYAELKPTLTELDLSNNLIMDIHQDALRDLTELDALHLNGNQLRNLRKDHLTGLKHLRFLNLSGNHLTKIEDHLIQGCDGLRVLDLSHNHIESLTSESFVQDFPSLEELHLQHNRIDRVHRGLFCIKTLLYINLDYNSLASIDGFSFGAGLTSVRIQYSSKLKEIKDDVFHHSRRLTSLVISNNHDLRVISEKAFNDKMSGTAVVLANNSLSGLSPLLLQWSNITEVDLTGNPWDCDCNLAWLTSYEFKSTVTCHTPLFLRDANLANLARETLPCAPGKRYKLEAAVLFAFVSSCFFLVVALACLRRCYRRILVFLLPSRVPYKTIYRNSDDAEGTTPV